MGRIINWVYGGLILWVALEAWFLPIIPNTFLPVIIIILGALVLFTPIAPGRGSLHTGTPKAPFQWLRRWVFGAYMVLSGLVSLIGAFSSFPWLARTSIHTFSGQIILLAIGAIYLLSAFAKTRNLQISSI